jgi:hemolysin III
MSAVTRRSAMHITAGMKPSPAPLRVKPRYRGLSHEIAAFLSLPAAVALVALARGSTAVVAAAVYGGSLVLLFTASAVFHRPTWRPRRRDILGRVDQAAIFLLIAGTYTPFCLLLDRGSGRAMLVAVWGGALAGVALALLWPGAPKRLMAAIYVFLGWFMIPVLPSLRAALPGVYFALLMGGGLVYTAGAVVYALRRPDPYPAVFGYHEIFHLLVIVAAACHFGVATAAIQALG